MVIEGDPSVLMHGCAVPSYRFLPSIPIMILQRSPNLVLDATHSLDIVGSLHSQQIDPEHEKGGEDK